MMTYDPLHFGPTPPKGRIKGELSDNPGAYQIHFLDSQSNAITDWTSVTVAANGRGPVDAAITRCPGPIDDIVAEWKPKGAANGTQQDGPTRIQLNC
jgi:hypothetical protein